MTCTWFANPIAYSVANFAGARFANPSSYAIRNFFALSTAFVSCAANFFRLTSWAPNSFAASAWRSLAAYRMAATWVPCSAACARII